MPPALLAGPKNKQRSGFEAQITLVERAEGETLPEGVCGRVQAVLVVYNQTDWYGTQFSPGCLSRSVAERVAANKVNFFLDHDKVVRCHIGIVRSVTDVGDSAVMVADILDTEDGRNALEYVKAVMAAGGQTGVSMGFIPRKGEVIKDLAGQLTGEYRFLDIELRESSLTPVPAIEGALVTGARNEDENDPEVMITALRTILASTPKERLDATLLEYGFQRTASPEPEETATPTTESDTPSAEGDGTRSMPVEERVKLLRANMATANT